MQKNIVITGEPKSGKSTLLWNVMCDISNKVGIVTKELRDNNTRVGFELETHTGEKALLAHVEKVTPYKVAKYFVDVPSLESILPNISSFGKEDILYLDEIGQMQLLSEQFKDAALRFFNSPNTCLATITSVYEDGFTRSVKNRDDIILVEITPRNREEKMIFILMLLKKIEKARRYVVNAERFTIQDNDTVLFKSEHDTRKLFHQNKHWNCSCDFFNQYKICSHSIATEEFIKSR